MRFRRGSIILLVASALGMAAAVHAAHGAVGSGGKAAKGAAAGANRAVPDNAVLAEVNGEKVTAAQLRARMRLLESRHERAMMGDDRTRDALFRGLINDRLVLQSMKRGGRTNSPEFLDRIRAVKVIGLGNIYLQVKRRDYVPSDNEVQPLLPRYWKTASVRVFFGATQEEAESARNEVLAGGDFERIVKERSIAPGADRGGRINNLRFGGAVFPEHIDHLLFTQKEGWVSPIFENELGWVFVRIEKSEDYPPEMIERAAEGAREQVRADAIQRMTDDEYAAHRVDADQALLSELDNTAFPKWKESFRRRLATVDGEEISVREFYWYCSMGLSGSVPGTGKGEIPGIFQSFVKSRAFSRKAEQEKLDETPEVREGLERYSEGILLDMFREEVARGVRVTGKDAREYFDRNREKLKKPEGRELHMIAAREERTALEILGLLKENPESFETLARHRSSDNSRKDKGKIGVVYKGQMNATFEKAVFGARDGQIVGPLFEKDSYYIFRVDRVIPPLQNPAYKDYAGEALALAEKEKVEDAVRKKKEDLYRKAAVVTRSELLARVEWPEPGESFTPAGHGGHGGH